MLCDVILKVPEETEVTSESFDQEVAWEIQQLDGEWPAWRAPMTHDIGGYKLIHAAVQIPGDNPYAMILGLITLYQLDWTILGMTAMHEVDTEGIPVTYVPVDVSILDYMNPRYIRNDEGDITGEMTKDLTWFPRWAGQAERVVS